MVRPSSFRKDNLQEGKPALFHQHALGFVLNGNQRIPSELVYPDRSLAVGLPASKLSRSFVTQRGSSTSSESTPIATTETTPDEEEETREEREARLRQVEIVIHTSESSDEDIRKDVRVLVVAFLSAVILQAGILGYMLVDVERGGAFSVAQRNLYSGMMVIHSFALVGLLSKLPNLIAVHTVFSAVIWFLGMLFCLQGVGDFLVLMLIAPLRYSSQKMRSLLIPHTFTVSPAT